MSHDVYLFITPVDLSVIMYVTLNLEISVVSTTPAENSLCKILLRFRDSELYFS
jgi:hypothetical protein